MQTMVTGSDMMGRNARAAAGGVSGVGSVALAFLGSGFLGARGAAVDSICAKGGSQYTVTELERTVACGCEARYCARRGSTSAGVPVRMTGCSIMGVVWLLVIGEEESHGDECS